MTITDKKADALSRIMQQEPVSNTSRNILSDLHNSLCIMKRPETGWLWDRRTDDYIPAKSVEYEWVVTGKGEKTLYEHAKNQLDNLNQVGDLLGTKQQDLNLKLKDLRGRVYKPEHTHEKND